MIDTRTKNMRTVLAALGGSGIDQLYQQLGSEIGIILTFHHISPDPEPVFAPNTHLTIHPDFLQTVITLVRKRGFEFVSIDEAQQRIANPGHGRRFAAVTVDDGYRNFARYGVPVLESEQVPFALYIATGLVDGTGIMWWRGIERLVQENDTIDLVEGSSTLKFDCPTPASKRNAFCHLEHHLMSVVPEVEVADVTRAWCEKYDIDINSASQEAVMNWPTIRELAANSLCTIGAHGVDHLALARLSAEKMKSELVLGADLIEAQLGKRPDHLAFPFGYRSAAAGREFYQAAQLGFQTAVTTRPGMIFPVHSSHLTALPRVSVNGWYQHKRYLKPLTSGLPTRIRQGFRRLDVN